MRRDAVTFGKMRRCSTCRRVKMFTEYSKRAKSYCGDEYHYTCKKCCVARAKEWYAKNKERGKANSTRRLRESREAAIVAIGGYVCSCCGETLHTMLDIDHPNGGGLKHRLIRGTWGMYKDMAANPTAYRVLCCNCNQSRRRNKGVCEHESAGLRALALAGCP